MRYKVKLTKLKSVSEPYVQKAFQYAQDGDSFDLYISELPEIGKCLYGSHINQFRGFRSSQVKSILSNMNDTIVFKTWNSVYKCEILDIEE